MVIGHYHREDSEAMIKYVDPELWEAVYELSVKVWGSEIMPHKLKVALINAMYENQNMLESRINIMLRY